MLSLTKRTEYALIALQYMIADGAVADESRSLGGRAPASAREIAERYKVPLPLLMNILKKLSTQGVLMSIRGAKGGYALARDPRQFTLAELIRLLEGPIALVDCACPPEQRAEAYANCRISGDCPIRQPLHGLHRRLMGFLETVTVWDVCGRHESAPSAAQSLQQFAVSV